MFYSLLRPLLFRLDAERAHHVTLKLLQGCYDSPLRRFMTRQTPKWPRRVMGLDFPNPVGLAAGLDKDGDYIDSLAALGFGFIEVGTVTPRPQRGNAQPRIFRLNKAHAIINRMGFNNRGVDSLVQNLKRMQYSGILGVNIGKNASTPVEQAVDDYLYCLRKVYPYASYVTVNISSPNTPKLRELQYGEALDELLGSLKNSQIQLSAEYGRYVPLVVKVAPDLTQQEIEHLAQTFLLHDIDGVIATNTTLSREGVESLHHANEAGGLSGSPLAQRSTEVVYAFHRLLADEIPIIASGGVMSPEDALGKIQAGAVLVQLYSGLVYRGPGLIQQIVHRLRG